MAGELLTITFGTLLCTAAAGADVAGERRRLLQLVERDAAHALRESLLQFRQVRGAVVRQRREVAFRDLAGRPARRGAWSCPRACAPWRRRRRNPRAWPLGQDRQRAAEVDPVVGPAVHLRLVDEDSRAGQLDLARPGEPAAGAGAGATRRRAAESAAMAGQRPRTRADQERMARIRAFMDVDFRMRGKSGRLTFSRPAPPIGSVVGGCPTPFVCAGRCCSPIMRVQNAQRSTKRNTCHDRRRGNQAGTHLRPRSPRSASS